MRQRIGEEERDKETRNEGSKETKRQDMRGGQRLRGEEGRTGGDSRYLAFK